MNREVVVIGGGVAGMTVAGELSSMGIDVVLLEKAEVVGGHAARWDRLFPDRRPSREVVEHLRQIPVNADVRCSTDVSGIRKTTEGFAVITGGENSIACRSVVLAAGYDLFQASRKEEYGYGIYDNVITSAELEGLFREGKPLKTHAGKDPARVVFIHCVGSRDEKVGNLYCSKVCCVTGVKQAIEVKEQHPACEVFCFYMDLRMFDRHFEELYFEAQQQWGIHFIRGRMSEIAELADHTLILKTEDTLSGKPMKLSADVVVLLVGFMPGAGTKRMVEELGIAAGNDGFLLPLDGHLFDNETSVPGLFLAGTVKGPAGITQTIADARATATEVGKYLRKANSQCPLPNA
jgi:heterodisulfide reductase subunit A